MSDTMTSDEIDKLLASVDIEGPTDFDSFSQSDQEPSTEPEREEPQKRKSAPFDTLLDFQYKNKVSSTLHNNLQNLIHFLCDTYTASLQKIKPDDDIMLGDISFNSVPAKDLKQYLMLQTDADKNDNFKVFIKEYSLNGAQIFLSVSVALINSILDRELTKPGDNVSKFSARQYFFNLIKSHMEQIIENEDLKIEEVKTAPSTKISGRYNVYETLYFWNDNPVPFVIALSSDACLKLFNARQEERPIHSMDYYTKQGGAIVLSGTRLPADKAYCPDTGHILSFPKPENNICDLVLDNRLTARGICGAFFNGNETSQLEITDYLLQGKDPASVQPDYFTGENNAFIVLASTNKAEAEKLLKTYTPDSQIRINLDTDLAVKDLLLVINGKICGTVEGFDTDTALKARILKKISPEIPII